MYGGNAQGQDLYQARAWGDLGMSPQRPAPPNFMAPTILPDPGYYRGPMPGLMYSNAPTPGYVLDTHTVTSSPRSVPTPRVPGATVVKPVPKPTDTVTTKKKLGPHEYDDTSPGAHPSRPGGGSVTTPGGGTHAATPAAAPRDPMEQAMMAMLMQQIGGNAAGGSAELKNMSNLAQIMQLSQQVQGMGGPWGGLMGQYANAQMGKYMHGALRGLGISEADINQYNLMTNPEGIKGVMQRQPQVTDARNAYLENYRAQRSAAGKGTFYDAGKDVSGDVNLGAKFRAVQNLPDYMQMSFYGKKFTDPNAAPIDYHNAREAAGWVNNNPTESMVRKAAGDQSTPMYNPGAPVPYVPIAPQGS